MEAKEEDVMESEGESPGPEVELMKELRQEQIRGKELLTQLKYAQADFENFRKRSEKEMADARESSIRGLVGRLLVVLDELALAVKHAGSGGKDKNLGEGFRMVQKNLEAALESVGVERIEAVGKQFNPALHEAVEKVEGAAEGDDVVVEEVRPGYTIKGQVLRPSMVRVGPMPEEHREEEE